MFIAIEGLDGSGKSTVSKLLAQALNAVYMRSPSAKYQAIRSDLDEIYQDNIYARQVFYASTVLDLSADIAELKKSESHVVVDRYWLSTMVYHNWKAQGQALVLEEIAGKLVVPDITVFIRVPLQERRRRLNARADNTVEDNLTLTAAADSTLNEFYMTEAQDSPLVGQWFIVDGTEAPEKIVQEIVSKIFQ